MPVHELSRLHVQRQLARVQRHEAVEGLGVVEAAVDGHAFACGGPDVDEDVAVVQRGYYVCFGGVDGVLLQGEKCRGEDKG